MFCQASYFPSGIKSYSDLMLNSIGYVHLYVSIL